MGFNSGFKVLTLRNVRLSQWCCWRFHCSGMLWCVVGWVVPNVREDCSALLFCSMQSNKNSLILDCIFLGDEDVAIIRNVGNHSQWHSITSLKNGIVTFSFACDCKALLHISDVNFNWNLLCSGKYDMFYDFCSELTVVIYFSLFPTWYTVFPSTYNICYLSSTCFRPHRPIIRRSKLYMQPMVFSPSADVFVVRPLRKSPFSTAAQQRHLQRERVP